MKDICFVCFHLAGKAEWATWACKTGFYVQPTDVGEDKEDLSSGPCE